MDLFSFSGFYGWTRPGRGEDSGVCGHWLSITGRSIVFPHGEGGPTERLVDRPVQQVSTDPLHGDAWARVRSLLPPRGSGRCFPEDVHVGG